MGAFLVALIVSFGAQLPAEKPPSSAISSPASIGTDPDYAALVVRICNSHGNIEDWGSGLILNRAGVVLTCGHIFRDAVGTIMVYRPDGRSYRGEFIARDSRDDLGAVQIADPGPIPQVRYALEEPKAVSLIGFPHGQSTAIVRDGERRGALKERSSVSYRVTAVDGDSGGPLFARGTLILCGVLWGSAGDFSAATSVHDIRRFLKERCLRFFRGGNGPGGTRILSPGQNVIVGNGAGYGASAGFPSYGGYGASYGASIGFPSYGYSYGYGGLYGGLYGGRAGGTRILSPGQNLIYGNPATYSASVGFSACAPAYIPSVGYASMPTCQAITPMVVSPPPVAPIAPLPSVQSPITMAVPPPAPPPAIYLRFRQLDGSFSPIRQFVAQVDPNGAPYYGIMIEPGGIALDAIPFNPFVR